MVVAAKKKVATFLIGFLGILSIDGKNLEVECLSDALLYQCNDLIQSLAGKYLKHLGNAYKDISSSGLNAEKMVDSMDDYEPLS